MQNIGLFIALAVGLVAVCIVFSGLIWAAVQDGRDERAFQAGHPELEEALRTHQPVRMPRTRVQLPSRSTPIRNARPSISVTPVRSPVAS